LKVNGLEIFSNNQRRERKMIPKTNLPNLAGDFVRIHKAITRGLTVGTTRGSDFIKSGFSDSSLQQGFALYLQTLIVVISAHHLGEDEVAFPALRQKLPTVPYDQLGADHVSIETALNDVKSNLPGMAGNNPADSLVKVVDGLNRILAIWRPHIQIEQSAFSAKAIAGAMSPAEQAEISTAFAKHSQDHVGAPFFALPFVLFNLVPEDRAEMSALMPKMLIEDLIPGEWKAKWSPMEPFLLD
jgi:hypothetical protein